MRPRWILPLLLAAVILSVTATVARAGVRNGESLMTLNVAYVFVKSELTDQTVDGLGFNLGIERVVYRDRFTVGANLSYVKMGEDFDLEGQPTRADYESIPVYAVGKVFIGQTRSRLLGYVGLGLGIHFDTLTTLETYEGLQNRQVQSEVGFGVAIPVGANFYLSQDAYLNLNFTFNWLGSSFFEQDLFNAVNVGVGYNY